MSDCDACVVRNRAICSALMPDELAALSKLGRKQMVSRGQTLVWEGDESLVVANVIQGVLKLSVSTQDGREQIVGVVFPSDFIGRPFGKESPYGVTALTDAEVCIFTRTAFDGFAKEHPDLQHKLLQRTLDELDRARQWMMLLGRKTASERIATLLIEISDRLGASGCSPIAPSSKSLNCRWTASKWAISSVSLLKPSAASSPSSKRLKSLNCPIGVASSSRTAAGWRTSQQLPDGSCKMCKLACLT